MKGEVGRRCHFGVAALPLWGMRSALRAFEHRCEKLLILSPWSIAIGSTSIVILADANFAIHFLIPVTCYLIPIFRLSSVARRAGVLSSNAVVRVSLRFEVAALPL